MKVELEEVLPGEIEKRSFEIITRELGDRILDEEKAPLIKRVIHTSADFEYADTLCFSGFSHHQLGRNQQLLRR